MPRIKGTLSQEILRKLLIGGMFLIAAQSPYFWLNVYKALFSGEKTKFKEKQVKDVFRYMKNKGLIDIETKRGQTYVRLTKEGEREAGRYQINKLQIKIPKKWDGKWRVVIFDIPEKEKIRRNAFRGKLKELGFFSLQKSVWVCPYSCEKEINLLREFFNLDKRNLKILEAAKIEDDKSLRKFFNL